MEKLANHFLITLYKMIFQEETPCMSREAVKAVSKLANWFASLNDTYLIVFGGHKSPHFLPRYATDKLVMQEVAYHLSTGLSWVLQMKKKSPWATLPL